MPTSHRLFRIVAALVAVLALGAFVPSAVSDDAKSVKDAKDERAEARRAQLEAKINLSLLKAEDLEVVEALQAATELVNLQQAKIDSARQRLRAAQDARLNAELELARTGAEIDRLRAQAVQYAVEAYVQFDHARTEAWLSAVDATTAAHKVALLDAVGTDTFDLVDHLRAIEDQRETLLAETGETQAEADAITAELGEALLDLEARQQVQEQLKAEVDARRARWEAELDQAEREEEELTAFIVAEQERIERELEAARRARLASPTAPSTNPNVGIISDGGWTWPTGGRAGSGFGQRLHPILGYYRMHTGMDIGGAQGAPIWAAHDGIVQSTGWNGGYGNAVIIGHGDATTTLYAHMSGFAVSPGDYVTAGQVIGYVGSTGLSTGPHLHFEVRLNGVPVDPRPYLP